MGAFRNGRAPMCHPYSVPTLILSVTDHEIWIGVTFPLTLAVVVGFKGSLSSPGPHVQVRFATFSVDLIHSRVFHRNCASCSMTCNDTPGSSNYQGSLI